MEKIRDALSKAPKGAASFKAALLLQEAWQGKSSCNGGFAAAILIAEKLLVRDEDPKKKGIQKRASPDAIEAWEKRLLAEELPENVETVPLHPPKPKPFFKKAADTEKDGGVRYSNIRMTKGDLNMSLPRDLPTRLGTDMSLSGQYLKP